MKISILLILSVLCIEVIFCQTTPVSGSLLYGDSLRTYKVYVPESYNHNEPCPIVFVLHGYDLKMDFMMDFTGMNDIADTGNFLVVYPQGLIIPSQWPGVGLPPSAYGWNFEEFSQNDDFGFLMVLLDTVSHDYNIDHKRVYFTGFSNGAYMSYALARRYPNRIAAVGGVGGKMTKFSYELNTSAIPVLIMHGTKDPIVDYYNDPSLQKAIDFWVELGACDTIPIITQLPDQNQTDNTTITKLSYPACINGSEIIHYRINNGGHIWPGKWTPKSLGNRNYDINASVELWNFFKMQSHPGPWVDIPETGLEDIKKGDLSIYPNPSYDRLSIETNTQGLQIIELYSLAGQLLLNIKIESPTHQVDLTSFQKGIYFITVRSRDRIWTEKIIKL